MSVSNYIKQIQLDFPTLIEKEKFLKITEDKDKGIEITKAQPGCISVVFLQDYETPTTIQFIETWKDKESYDNHIEFRKTLNQIYPLLLWEGDSDTPPTLKVKARPAPALTSMDMESDESRIKKVINSLCTCEPLNAMEHCNFDYMNVNEIGQPMSIEQWDRITKDGTVIEECNQLVKFNRIKISDNLAFVCYTTHCIYSLNGTRKDEKRVKTTILERSRQNGTRWFALFTQNSSALSSSAESPKFWGDEFIN